MLARYNPRADPCPGQRLLVPSPAPGEIVKFVVSAAFNDPDHLLELAVSAEECGFEALAFPDHVVHPEKLDTPYPYTADGSRRWQAFTPWVDPWVAIGACAAVTTRLRFTNNVFVLAMRNPFLAAKAIATAACCRADASRSRSASAGRTSSTRCLARTSKRAGCAPTR